MPPPPQLLETSPIAALATQAYAGLRRVAENPCTRCAYFSVVALVAMWPVLGAVGTFNDLPDSQYFQLYEEVARLTVVRFHELPLWNPYYCGGISDIGTPSARFVSPTFLLTLLFGTFRGEALTITFMTFVGLEGTFRYVRARGGGALAAMLVAPVYALSGVFARSEVLGWTNFFGFHLAPWALYGVRRALQGSRRGVVIASIAMAWMIGFGGTYTGPLTAILALFETLVSVVERARRPRRLLLMAEMGLLVVLLSAALAAARLWPIVETLTASPRLLGGTPATSPYAIWSFLFGPRPADFRGDDFAIGVAIVPVVALGVWRRRAFPLVLACGLSLWLALGYGVRTSLFAALRTVPPFTMLRAPERFLVFVALAAAGIAAIGVRRIEVAARRRPAWLLVAAVAHALLLVDTWSLVRDQHIHASGRHVVPIPSASEGEFRQTRGNRWLAEYFPFFDRGSLTCFDDYEIKQSPVLRGDLPAEEYLRDTTAGRVTRAAWSPDRIELRVALTKPARVYVNQNWHPGWRSDAGAVVSDDGLLAVDLPEGTRTVVLQFLPRSAVGGIGATALGLIAALAIAWRAGRRDATPAPRELAVTAALCLMPFAAIGLTLATMHEPPRPPPARVTPDGEPMIVDAPPPGSERVDARWSEGITLEAGHVHTWKRADGYGTDATIELDWRLDRRPPAGLGVFASFEKRTGAHVGADHVLLSRVLLLEDAPLNRTIRDVSDVVSLPVSDPGTVWTVRAGVWRARRDGTRLPPLDPGPQPPVDDAVYVTSYVVPTP